MSLIGSHQIEVQTWLTNNQLKRIYDSIRQCNNPAKRYDDHALQYIVGIFYSGMPAVEYSVDISGTHCLWLTS